MVDWPGLLNWTMKYTDGTFDTNVQPLDQETRQWLQEALEAYTFDEVKRTKELLDNLQKPEKPDDPNDEMNRINWLEELLDLVEGLENARDLVRMNLYPILVKVMLESKYSEVRRTAYMVFTSCNSNNSMVQDASVRLGGFKLLNSIIHEEKMLNKEAAISSLTSMIKGDNLSIKRLFLDIEGVQFLEEILKNKDTYKSNKIRTKAILMLTDLIHYDHMYEYKDITEYNLGGKKQTVDLKINSKKEEKKELDEFIKPAKELGEYKNFVKTQLIKDDFAKFSLDLIDDSNLKQQIDFRPNLFSILINIIKFDVKSALSKEQIEQIKNLRKKLVEENKKSENLYEGEVSVIDNLLSLH